MKVSFFRYLNIFVCLFVLILLSAESSAQNINVSGTVLSHKGVPVKGVLVKVADSECATLTDMTGSFSIRIPDRYSRRKMVFVCYGFNNDTIDIMETNSLTVVLSEREKQHISEIMISTQKRLQRDVDVPIAVTTIDDERQQERNLDQIDEIARYVPGFVSSLQDYVTPLYCIRGVASDGGESYSQQRVSVYLDNVSIGRAQSSVLELYDMERVEVVKGPQGTLFGRGAEVGAIHYVRKKPDSEFDFNAMAGYGSYNHRTAQAMVNLPLGTKVATRFAARYDAHDGYIDNLAGGRLNGKTAYAAKNSTSFFFNDRNTLTLTFDVLKNDNPCASFKTNRVGLPDDLSDISPYTKAYLTGGDQLGLKRSVANGIINYDLKINDRLSVTSVMGARSYHSLEHYDVDGCFYDMLNGMAEASGYQYTGDVRINWGGAGNKIQGFVGVSGIMEYNKHEYRFNGNQKNFFPPVVGKSLRASLVDLPAGVAAGVGAALDELGNVIKSQVPSVDGAQIDALLASFKPLAADAVENNLKKLYNSWYLESTHWEKTPDVVNGSAEVVYSVLSRYIGELMGSNQQVGAMLSQVLGGATVDQFVRSFKIEDQLAQNPALVAISNVELQEDYFENQIDQNTLMEGSLFADVTWNFAPRFYLTLGMRGTGEFQETSYESNSLTAPIVNSSLIYQSSGGKVYYVDTLYQSWVGRAVLNWKFDDTHNVYASVSKGRRPAQIYFDLRPDRVKTLEPELLVNYELGIKGRSKYGYFNYYASIYYYNWKNFQSYVYSSTSDGTVLMTNDDSGKARAFGFDGSLIYTFSDRVNAYIDYSYVNIRYSEYDMNGDKQALAGNRLRLVPEHNFDGGFRFKFPVSKDAAIFWHPSLSLVGRLYFDDYNTAQFLQKGYTLVNSNLAYKWCGKGGKINYEASIYGKNLTDAKYLVDAGNSGDVMGYPTFVAGSPFTFGAIFRISLNPNRNKNTEED